MSGSISYPRVDRVAGYVTILGIVNYISDKVFLFEKQGGCQENMQVMRKKVQL